MQQDLEDAATTAALLGILGSIRHVICPIDPVSKHFSCPAAMDLRHWYHSHLVTLYRRNNTSQLTSYAHVANLFTK